MVTTKPRETTIQEIILCNAKQIQRWFKKDKINQAFLGMIWNVKESEEDVAA